MIIIVFVAISFLEYISSKEEINISLKDYLRVPMETPGCLWAFLLLFRFFVLVIQFCVW
jgi:hypothetical protein